MARGGGAGGRGGPNSGAGAGVCGAITSGIRVVESPCCAIAIPANRQLETPTNETDRVNNSSVIDIVRVSGLVSTGACSITVCMSIRTSVSTDVRNAVDHAVGIIADEQ